MSDYCSKPFQAMDDRRVTRGYLKSAVEQKEQELKEMRRRLQDETGGLVENGAMEQPGQELERLQSLQILPNGIDVSNVRESDCVKESGGKAAVLLKPLEAGMDQYQQVLSRFSMKDNIGQPHNIKRVGVVIRGDLDRRADLVRSFSNIIGKQLAGFEGELGVLWINTGEFLYNTKALSLRGNPKIFQLMENVEDLAVVDEMKAWLSC